MEVKWFFSLRSCMILASCMKMQPLKDDRLMRAKKSFLSLIFLRSLIFQHLFHLQCREKPLHPPMDDKFYPKMVGLLQWVERVSLIGSPYGYYCWFWRYCYVYSFVHVGNLRSRSNWRYLLLAHCKDGFQ